MFKKAIVAAVLVPCVCHPALGQTPSPTPKPVASVGAKTLIDSLAPAEIDETIRVLKSNFIDPNALKDQEINRATLEGLLARLHGGAVLVPSFEGLTTGPVDGETAAAAEPIAVALKSHARALLIGQPTAGRAVEYSDFPRASGKTLRVAVEEVIGADGHSLFPDGVKPDLPVETPPAQKRQIFVLSAQRGIAAFVFETERPHFNEAALIAGTNPELEARQQRRNSDEHLHDAVLQRAVDVIASIAVFQ